MVRPPSTWWRAAFQDGPWMAEQKKMKDNGCTNEIKTKCHCSGIGFVLFMCPYSHHIKLYSVEYRVSHTRSFIFKILIEVYLIYNLC